MGVEYEYRNIEHYLYLFQHLNWQAGMAPDINVDMPDNYHSKMGQLFWDLLSVLPTYYVSLYYLYIHTDCKTVIFYVDCHCQM